MRNFVTVALLGHFPPLHMQAPKEDTLAVFENWTKAFAASDVDVIVKRYANDALFIGTGSKAVVVRPEGVRSYFEDALRRNRLRGATLNSHQAMVLSDAAVVITGLDTVTACEMDSHSIANGRVTFVVAKRGADWQIVHFPDASPAENMTGAQNSRPSQPQSPSSLVTRSSWTGCHGISACETHLAT